MLLTSGRVGKNDWASCRRDAAAEGGLGPVLLSRSLVGPNELQVVCMMSAADAAFAMAVGRIDGSTQTVDGEPPELSAPQGIDRDWLLGETGRRLAALASLRNPLSPITDRVRSTPAARDTELSDARADLLRHADGRHTARDIAVLLGRGLFAVTTELSRMAGEGLIEVLAPSPGDSAPADWPPPDRALGRLPLRRRGASRINDVLPLRPVSARRTGPADWAQ
ncbi:hypothetical protein ACGFX4_18810 [Kitasatospora sp. NPDC048365]|uniref:hypothetical protein n=1 Tax=Kitasatospora sp. NPDC048365 TaxID=3364050 RepID=UPI00371FDC46